MMTFKNRITQIIELLLTASTDIVLTICLPGVKPSPSGDLSCPILPTYYLLEPIKSHPFFFRFFPAKIFPDQ